MLPHILVLSLLLAPAIKASIKSECETPEYRTLPAEFFHLVPHEHRARVLSELLVTFFSPKLVLSIILEYSEYFSPKASSVAVDSGKVSLIAFDPQTNLVLVKEKSLPSPTMDNPRTSSSDLMQLRYIYAPDIPLAISSKGDDEMRLPEVTDKVKLTAKETGEKLRIALSKFVHFVKKTSIPEYTSSDTQYLIKQLEKQGKTFVHIKNLETSSPSLMLAGAKFEGEVAPGLVAISTGKAVSFIPLTVSLKKEDRVPKQTQSFIHKFSNGEILHWNQKTQKLTIPKIPISYIIAITLLPDSPHRIVILSYGNESTSLIHFFDLDSNVYYETRRITRFPCTHLFVKKTIIGQIEVIAVNGNAEHLQAEMILL